MTPDELKVLVAQGDVHKVAEALSDLDASQRSKLSKTATSLHKDLQHVRWGWRQDIPRIKKLRAEMEILGVDWNSLTRSGRAPDCSCEIAMLGCCPISTLKKADIYVGHRRDDKNYGDACLRVLQDRSPEWMDDLVEAWLMPSSDDIRRINWKFLKRLIDAGLCKKPTGPDYIHVMVDHLSYSTTRKDEDRLRNQQELIDSPDFVDTDVYKLFEIDTTAFAYDWCSWDNFVKQMVDTGKVDRARIINCAIRGASNRFKQNTISGFIKVLELLEVTPEEWRANLDDLVVLLSSHISVVVTFAVKQLKTLFKEGAIESERLLESLSPVFQCPTKGQPKAALTLIQQTARKHKETVPLAINTTLCALDHADADVQEKAIKLLGSWSDRAHPDHATAIRERLDNLAPSVIAEAQALIEKIGGTADDELATSQTDSPASIPSTDRSQWQAAINEISDTWRTMTAMEELLSTFDQPVYPPRMSFGILDVPVLSGLQPVIPIADHAELIDTIAHAIEVVESPMDVERIMDGISRLGRIPKDLIEAAAPVGARLTKQQIMENSRGLASAPDSVVSAARLLQIALKVPQFTNRDEFHFSVDSVRHSLLFARRLQGLIDQVNSGQLGPLLSAPTHERGWIDPVVFAERINERLLSGAEINETDFLLGLLRMAPDRREVALQALTTADSPWIALTSIALNGPTDAIAKPKRLDKACLQVAAHVRTAAISESEQKRLKLNPATINGRSPMQATLTVNKKTANEHGAVYDDLNFKIEHADSFDSLPALKLMYHTERKVRWAIYSAWRTRMDGWNSKVTTDHYLVRAATNVRSRLNENSSSFEPNYAFYEELFEPDRIWTEFGHLVVLLGLISKDNDVKRQAIDAMIEAVLDGRADPAIFADVTHTIFGCGWSGLKRLADSLAEVARMTPLHRWFATASLEPLITTFRGKLPIGAASILELYLDGLIEMGLAVDKDVESTCSVIKGSSKSAKAAKRIIAAKLVDRSEKRDEAKSIALQSRLDRADRWQNALAVV